MEKQEQDNNENLEQAEYHKRSEYSQAELVREAVTKIKEARGKEMKPGYFNIITQRDGSTKKEYVEDTRKGFIGSVEYLKSLLTNEIATSTKATKLITDFNRKKKNSFDKYSVNEQDIQGGKVVMLKRKYIPEVDDIFLIGNPLQNRKTLRVRYDIKEIRGVYNPRVKMYWDHMVLIYDFLFQGLINLIAEVNHFKQKAGF